VALGFLLLVHAACGRQRDTSQVRVVDLMVLVKDADRRPSTAAFDQKEHTFGGRSRASLIVPPQSRLTYTLPLPHHGRLQIFAGVEPNGGPASVAFRVGISDDRIYTPLVEVPVTSDASAAGWIPISVDLSEYAGRKWSLFYRPDERRWKLILGTYTVAGAPVAAYIGEPAIETDNDSAREYLRRLSAMR
jgi:hypothetical protein